MPMFKLGELPDTAVPFYLRRLERTLSADDAGRMTMLADLQAEIPASPWVSRLWGRSNPESPYAIIEPQWQEFLAEVRAEIAACQLRLNNKE